MKKRLLLILFVLSIILSVCTASILTTSAAANDSDEVVGEKISLYNCITRDNSVNISWSNVSSAKGWLIAYSETGISSWKYLVANCDVAIKATNNQRAVTLNLASSKTYYFAIFALNTQGYFIEEGNKKSLNAKTLIDYNTICVPCQFKRTSVSTPKLGMVRMMDGFLNVNWKKTSGATKYYVWIRNSTTRRWLKATSTNGSDYTTSSYFNIPAKQLGKLNDIKVRAVFKDNSYTTSSISTVSNMVTPIYGINWSGNYFNVHWKAISGASKYEICRFYNGQKKYYLCDNDSKGYNNITISANNQVSFIDRGISKVGPYAYQIRAIGSNGETSTWSTYVSVEYNPTVRPTNKQRFVDIANATLYDYGKKYWDKAKEWHEKWHEENVYDGREADWCCMYAAWILNEMNELDVDVKDTYGYYIDAGNFADNLMTLGKWRNWGSYTPKVGDVIIFGDNPINGRNHVGVVTAVSGGKVYTNEGNTGSEYCYLARVNRKSYSLNDSDSNILGYGCTGIS